MSTGSYYCKCKSRHKSIRNVCEPVPNSIQVRVEDARSTTVLVIWSNITYNIHTVKFITIVYRGYGVSSYEWSTAPEIYTPNTTRAVVKNLRPDTYYTIKVKLNLIYDIPVFSNVDNFQTTELPSEGKSSGSNGNKGVVIVTSSVVGSAVAIAIALSLVALFLRRRKPKPLEDAGTDVNMPYLQDLIEMRMFSRDVNHENTEGNERYTDTLQSVLAII